jgi:biopolymer transport protein ExbD
MFWNGELLALEALPQRFAQESVKPPQPELHIRGDKAVRYEHVALAMTAARQAELKKIGFVTDPVN